MSDASDTSDEGTVVEVVVTEQQAVIFDNLRRDGGFGTTDEEIVRNVFREFVRQEGG